MATFALQTGNFGEFIVTRSTSPLTFIEYPENGPGTNEQFLFVRWSAAPWAANDPGYLITTYDQMTTLTTNLNFGDGGAPTYPVMETADAGNQSFTFSINSYASLEQTSAPYRLSVGFVTHLVGMGLGTGQPGDSYFVQFNELTPTPEHQAASSLQLQNMSQPAPVLTVSGQDGAISIACTGLDAGNQYDVCYLGLRSPVDLYTTQGLQGLHYFGIETADQNGSIPPILDQVPEKAYNPGGYVVVAVERILEPGTRLVNGIQIDRVVDAFGVLPASAFLH